MEERLAWLRSLYVEGDDGVKRLTLTCRLPYEWQDGRRGMPKAKRD
jgi:hypothetical protein